MRIRICDGRGFEKRTLGKLTLTKIAQKWVRRTSRKGWSFRLNSTF